MRTPKHDKILFKIQSIHLFIYRVKLSSILQCHPYSYILKQITAVFILNPAIKILFFSIKSKYNNTCKLLKYLNLCSILHLHLACPLEVLICDRAKLYVFSEKLHQLEKKKSLHDAKTKFNKSHSVLLKNKIFKEKF